MKLNRWMTSAVAVTTVALACGCSSSAPMTAKAPMVPAIEATGTTSLMSAELTAPAPRVGKSHLAVDADDVVDGNANASANANGDDELAAPKEPRRSDGSRRGGHFGTSK